MNTLATFTRSRLGFVVFLFAMLIAGWLAVRSIAAGFGLAYGDDAGQIIDAGPIPTVDAGPPANIDHGPATNREAPPAPSDPVAHPGDAINGFRLWWGTSWVYGVAFGVCSLLIALGARVKYLRTGWRAIGVGTAVAAIIAALTAKVAGLSDAQVVAAALNVMMIGAVWLLHRNQSTIDLSTATPDQITAALMAAAVDKVPAAPLPTARALP